MLSGWVVVGAIALSLVASHPAAAMVRSEPGSTNLGTFTFSAQPVTLDGSGECVDAVMNIAIETVEPGIYWVAEWTVAPAGVTPAAYGGEDGTGSVTVAANYSYCPSVFRATNVVRGEIEFTRYDDESGDVKRESAEFQSIVGVTRAGSSTVITRISRDDMGNVQVMGRVTAVSAKYGRVGTYGTVQLLVQGPRNRWIRVGEGSAGGGLGEFVAYTTKPVTSKKAVFRVDFMGSASTSPSKSKPRR
jgi:hypothetical protein